MRAVIFDLDGVDRIDERAMVAFVTIFRRPGVMFLLPPLVLLMKKPRGRAPMGAH